MRGRQGHVAAVGARITNLSQKVLLHDRTVCTVASGTPESPLNQFKTHAIGPPVTPRPGGRARATGPGGAEVPGCHGTSTRVSPNFNQILTNFKPAVTNFKPAVAWAELVALRLAASG